MTDEERRSAARSVMQRLHEAVEILATDPGSMNERLRWVGERLAPLQAKDFPDTVEREFKAVMAALTEQGSIDDTVAQMPAKEAGDIAKAVFDLYCRVQEIRTGHSLFS